MKTYSIKLEGGDYERVKAVKFDHHDNVVTFYASKDMNAEPIALFRNVVSVTIVEEDPAPPSFVTITTTGEPAAVPPSSEPGANLPNKP